jgi:tRNA(His) 5'-end guanylyltransferase
MKTDDLGDRMKKHEYIYRTYLPKKQYYILRLDMKCGHSYTKNLNKPFDDGFIEDLQFTAKYLCEEIQGSLLSFQQSDEITIVFSDLQSEAADIWFGGNIQKIVSVAASLATSKFNELREDRGVRESNEKWENGEGVSFYTRKLAQFDARVFSVSQRHEVLNNLYWRQKDASKNSVQMLARSLFSHKECQGLNGSQLQDKMMLEKEVNWNDIETTKKRGSACYKELKLIESDLVTGDKFRGYWKIDNEIPIFSQDWEWFNGKII